MRLTTKIMIGVALVISVLNGALFYLIGHRHNRLLMDRLTESARSFYKQIVVTRAWVAHYDGVFVKYQPGVEVNPYLMQPLAITTEGDTLINRNPAQVTRELSELGETMGGFRFHLTSLKPLNPKNKPTTFEREALLAVAANPAGKISEYGEVTKLERVGGSTFFRYFAPLYTEESCLSCHGDQGYKVGDVRGGISIIVPAQQVQEAMNRNILLMVFGCLASSAAITLLIYYLIRGTVIRPLRRLESATEKIARGDYSTTIPTDGDDEIGDLSRAFDKMQQAIQESMDKQIASEKMVALGQLSAGIAHEIRNPLFAVRNDLEYLMRKFPGNGEQTEIYLEMEDGVARINRTLQAVLDYSKPHKPEFSRRHIRQVIERCMVLMEKQFSKENVEIEIDVPDALPLLDLDIHRMEQVLVNLLTNAKRALASGNGKGKITIRARRHDSVLRLSVTDNGIGMNKGEVSRIFDPFYTRSPDGTGLGLTIVKRIVQQHKGEIQVKSRFGAGTTFVIELPLDQQTEVAC